MASTHPFHRRRAFALVSALALLAGCPDEGGGGGGEEDKPEERKESAALAEIPVASTEDASAERYSYNSIGKRDPFRSFIKVDSVPVNEGGPVGPLQIYEIDEYKLKGIIWNIQAPRALVEDPDGVGHVVDLGTLIGKNWGKVTQIKPEEIVITEEYRDPIENELIINEVTMRLPVIEDTTKKK
jgi:type IV pilus assembly protein PilP